MIVKKGKVILCCFVALVVMARSVKTQSKLHNPYKTSRPGPTRPSLHILRTRGGVETYPPVESLIQTLCNIVGNVVEAVSSSHWSMENIVRSASTFLERQSDEAQKRREYYQTNANQAATYTSSLLHPVRVVKLTVLAYILLEVLEFIAGNESLQTYWSGTLQPMLQAKTADIQEWFERGRSEGGLFCPSTWTRANLQQHPGSIIRAWNNQFSPKYQRVMGTAAGLIVSPTLWALTGALGSSGVALLLLAEVNFFLGEKIELTIRSYDSSLSRIWGEVDVALEHYRRFVHKTWKQPFRILQTWVQHCKTSTTDDKQILPAAMQQGILLGIILGFVAGA